MQEAHQYRLKQAPPPSLPMSGVPDRWTTGLEMVDKTGTNAIEQRPLAQGLVGLPLQPAANMQQLPPGMQYLQEQVQRFDGPPTAPVDPRIGAPYFQPGFGTNFAPDHLQWVNQRYGGEIFERRCMPPGPSNLTDDKLADQKAHGWLDNESPPKSDAEKAAMRRSGWVRYQVLQGEDTPTEKAVGSCSWNFCEKPPVAKGQNDKGQNYYIPWVLPDPNPYPEGCEPALTWQTLPDMPYEEQPVVVGRGSTEFKKTEYLLKKITWYVPDGVEFGPPRLPVQVYGVPPERTHPKPAPTYPCTHADGAVDMAGLMKSEEHEQMRQGWISDDRRDILQEYKRQAKINKERGQGCAEALI